MPGYWVSGIGVVLLLWRVNAVQPRCDAQQGPIAANRNGSSCVAWSQTCADCRRPDLIFLSSFSTLWPRIDRHGIGRMSIYQVTMQVPCQALTINGLADCADLNVNFADSPGGPMGWNGAVAHGAATGLASGHVSCPRSTVTGTNVAPQRGTRQRAPVSALPSARPTISSTGRPGRRNPSIPPGTRRSNERRHRRSARDGTAVHRAPRCR